MFCSNIFAFKVLRSHSLSQRFKDILLDFFLLTLQLYLFHISNTSRLHFLVWCQIEIWVYFAPHSEPVFLIPLIKCTVFPLLINRVKKTIKFSIKLSLINLSCCFTVFYI